MAASVSMILFPLGLGPWGFHVLGLGSWRDVFALLAVIGIIYGALVALVQKGFKFVIGYSSVSHMGFILLGLMTSESDWNLRSGTTDVLSWHSGGPALRGRRDAWSMPAPIPAILLL